MKTPDLVAALQKRRDAFAVLDMQDAANTLTAAILVLNGKSLPIIPRKAPSQRGKVLYRIDDVLSGLKIMAAREESGREFTAKQVSQYIGRSEGRKVTSAINSRIYQHLINLSKQGKLVAIHQEGRRETRFKLA